MSQKNKLALTDRGLNHWKEQEFKLVDKLKMKWVILLQLFWIPASFRDIGRCRLTNRLSPIKFLLPEWCNCIQFITSTTISANLTAVMTNLFYNILWCFKPCLMWCPEALVYQTICYILNFLLQDRQTGCWKYI